MRKFSDEVFSVCSDCMSKNNSGAQGTYNYASPEQLSDSEIKLVDFKSDIYSLGIVIFQLFYVMITFMESQKTIKDLKKELFPVEFQ